MFGGISRNKYYPTSVPLEHESVAPLQTILFSLKFMADHIRNGSNLAKIQYELRSCGYDRHNFDCDKTQMMKALGVAVNEAIQEKKIEAVKYVDDDTMKLNDELLPLLEIDSNKSLHDYFSPVDPFSYDQPWPSMNSPLDLAKLLKPKAPQWLVKNIIERQFDIKWSTSTGEPDYHSFYQFCDTKNTTKHFKYKPRLAHVKTTLYKECCRRPEQSLYHMPKNVLCPEVYINTVSGWKTWSPDEEGKFKEEDLPGWIDEPIFEFIKENADVQKSDDESLKQSLEKPTVYWLLIQDCEFMEGGNLKLKPTGQTQVYVGKANNGILGRWLKDSDNHCEMMKKCLYNVWAMTTYDPSRLEGIQLVDARLALAKVRGEETALFVIKTFGDDLEKAEIAVQKAQNDYDELRESEGLSPFDASENNDSDSDASQDLLPSDASENNDSDSDASQDMLPSDASQDMLPSDASENNDSDSDTSEESLPAISSEPLRKAWNELQSAKSFLTTLSKDSKTKKYGEVIKQLEDEERYHRQGKRDKLRNIIPYDKFKMTWKPTLMGYGMNFK